MISASFIFTEKLLNSIILSWSILEFFKKFNNAETQ